MAENEGVWSSIADQDHINVRLEEVPDVFCGGTVVRYADGSVWILIDKRLDSPRRRAVLLHELVHLERGTVRYDDLPAKWEAMIAREEAAVDRIVAERLVPEAELRAFVGRCLSIENYVTALDVADEFGVPVEVAERACRRAS